MSQPFSCCVHARARAGIRQHDHHHVIHLNIGVSRSSLFRSCGFLVFLVVFFAAVCAGFVALGFVDLKRASKRNQEC